MKKKKEKKIDLEEKEGKEKPEMGEGGGVN